MVQAARADAQRNRELLVAAAREAFADRGTDASLRDVARSAGVGIGTLYRHFPTREALLEALVESNFEELRARADELLDSHWPTRTRNCTPHAPRCGRPARACSIARRRRAQCALASRPAR